MFTILPDWFTKILSIVIGLLIGSFLNVVIARFPLGQSVVQPRSRCPHCERTIPAYDNIPLLSFLILKGKCRFCQHPISFRYPLVELLTALLFLACRVRFGWSPVLILRDWPFVSLLIAITFIDLDHRIIPDPMSLGGLCLGLVTSWMVGEPGWQGSLIGAVFGFSVFYGLAWIYQKWAGRSGLGGGDIKLLAMMGSFIGPSGVFATIFISSIFGSLVGIGWALLTRKKEVMGMAIPFGPFLVFGALYYYLLGDILWFQFMTPM